MEGEGEGEGEEGEDVFSQTTTGGLLRTQGFNPFKPWVFGRAQ